MEASSSWIRVDSYFCRHGQDDINFVGPEHLTPLTSDGYSDCLKTGKDTEINGDAVKVFFGHSIRLRQSIEAVVDGIKINHPSLPIEFCEDLALAGSKTHMLSEDVIKIRDGFSDKSDKVEHVLGYPLMSGAFDLNNAMTRPDIVSLSMYEMACGLIDSLNRSVVSAMSDLKSVTEIKMTHSCFIEGMVLFLIGDQLVEEDQINHTRFVDLIGGPVETGQIGATFRIHTNGKEVEIELLLSNSNKAYIVPIERIRDIALDYKPFSLGGNRLSA